MTISRKLSVEDGNLNKIARVTSRSNPYSDIDLLFEKKRSGDIFKKNDAASVKQAVKNIILTNFLEKPFNPFYGANIRALLFELADDATQVEIEENVKLAIQNFEPRAKVLNVQSRVRSDQNGIFVRVIFRVMNSQEVVELETFVSRLR
jgi:phage baseplate assembly protein W